MPIFIAALLGGIVQLLGTMVGRVLVSLGIGYATYRGVDVLLTFVRDQTMQYLSNGLGQLPMAAYQIAGVLQVGTCLNILFSAWSARLLISGFVGGVRTRMVSK